MAGVIGAILQGPESDRVVTAAQSLAAGPNVKQLFLTCRVAAAAMVTTALLPLPHFNPAYSPFLHLVWTTHARSPAYIDALCKSIWAPCAHACVLCERAVICLRVHS